MASNNQPGNSNSKIGNPLDENLLNRPKESSAEKAGNFRETQRNGQEESTSQNTGEASTMGEQRMIEKREAAQTEEKKEKKEDADSKPNPANEATSNLLRGAWENLIPSYGLTLIWINIHVFLGTVFGPKFFCKLGMEWMNQNIKQAQFDEAKKVGKVAGTFEGMGLACLDLGCLVMIIWNLMVISLILNIFSLEGLSHILGWIWDKAKNIFTN